MFSVSSPSAVWRVCFGETLTALTLLPLEDCNGKPRGTVWVCNTPGFAAAVLSPAFSRGRQPRSAPLPPGRPAPSTALTRALRLRHKSPPPMRRASKVLGHGVIVPHNGPAGLGSPKRYFKTFPEAFWDTWGRQTPRPPPSLPYMDSHLPGRPCIPPALHVSSLGVQVSPPWRPVFSIPIKSIVILTMVFSIFRLTIF